jgi:hypothetical protein
MKPITRFYYPPGLIIIILLPALFFLYDFKSKIPRKVSLVITYGRPRYPHDIYNEEWEKKAKRRIEERKYTGINLNGNKEENKIKVDFARIEIRDLIARNDTVNGIHLHFNNEIKYCDLVYALDLCNNEIVSSYWFSQNDIWLFSLSEFEKASNRERGRI